VTSFKILTVVTYVKPFTRDTMCFISFLLNLKFNANRIRAPTYKFSVPNHTIPYRKLTFIIFKRISFIGYIGSFGRNPLLTEHHGCIPESWSFPSGPYIAIVAHLHGRKMHLWGIGTSQSIRKRTNNCCTSFRNRTCDKYTVVSG